MPTTMLVAMATMFLKTVMVKVIKNAIISFYQKYD